MPVDLAAAAAAAPPLSDLVAAHASLTLAHSPTAGRHLRAARRIPALSAVLLDPAILWYPASCDSMGATIPGLCEVRSGQGLEALDGILAQLAPFAAAAAAPLPAPLPAVLPRHDLYIAACALNALGALVDEEAPAERRRLPMICPVAALLNHSCEPNCSYEGYYDAERGAPGIRVYAEEDIEEGEEVTISYVTRTAPWEERRDKLKAMYGFDCACARCSSGVEDTAVFTDRGSCIPSGSGGAGGGHSLLLPPAAAAALMRERAAWLEAHAGHPAALTGASGSPPPLLAPGDQALYSTLYDLLGRLWGLEPTAEVRALQCAVGAAVCNDARALGRRGRGRCFPSDALLITGHFHALAGRTAEAAELYRRARALFASLYGEGDYRVQLAGELAAAPPSSKREAERAEVARLSRTRNWCALYGLRGSVLEGWTKGVPARSSGAKEAAGDALAMRELLKASRAIMMQGGLLARVQEGGQ